MFAPSRLPAAAHGGRRHRRNTSSSLQSDSSCDYFEGEPLEEDSQEDEDSEWPWRPSCAPSSSSRHGCTQAYPSPSVPRDRMDGAVYSTPSSPSPARLQLQRVVQASPPMPRRHSHSRSVSYTSARTPADAESMTPHEAVLRSRLEGVLKNAKVQERRTRSIERRELDSGSGNSMASSRNMSGEGDFFFGANGDSSLTSLSSNDARHHPSSPRHNPRALHMAPHPSPRSSHKPLLSSLKGSAPSGAPLTPPPSPPFNARQAAAQCRAMDGYVSFATIEGLGMPEGSDEDEEANSRSRWFQWLHISGKTSTHDRARDRSQSSSSASR